jgi:hypothetical protein
MTSLDRLYESCLISMEKSIVFIVFVLFIFLLNFVRCGCCSVEGAHFVAYFRVCAPATESSVSRFLSVCSWWRILDSVSTRVSSVGLRSLHRSQLKALAFSSCSPALHFFL